MEFIKVRNGYLVKGSNGLIVDEKETIALADKYKMFIIGASIDDYLK